MDNSFKRVKLKNTFYYSVFLIIGFLCIVSCSSKKKQTSKDKDWLSIAIKSEKHIQTAKYLSDQGEVWKVMPDSINSKVNNALYHGTPGIVLFYLELYNATQDTSYLNEAQSGANYLTKILRDTLYKAEEVGLYTGLAGIGFTLTEVFKVTKAEKYKQAALKTIRLLDSSSNKSANGIHWGSITDIVYGSAGIGLYLQYVADQLDSKKADSLSVLVAEGLLDNAIETHEGLRWKFFPDYNTFLDNFSHGTAGIAYFLAQTYKRTQNKKYLDAAMQGEKFLDSITNNKGYVPHHLPGGEDLYYLNWCHGPSGTSRLYYALYDITKDDTWLDKITHPANNMMAEGIDKTETPGYWNNVGKCCGAVSVAEYYLWLYDITGNKEYLDFSHKMTQQIMNKSTQEGDHIKWLHAENRRSPDELTIQTGLMQGSAGMGLWFLQLNAHQNDTEPSIVLPDKPTVSSIK